MSSETVTQRFRILLVEDNPGDVYLFEQALKSAGLDFELTVIEDGAEALAFARRQGKYAEAAVPDLAVLDANLPKNEGVEVLQAIRQSEHLSSIPVAIMSSSVTPSDQEKANELRVERYIAKPLDLDQYLLIGETLKQVLRERAARQ